MKSNSNFCKQVITLFVVLSLIACDSETLPETIVEKEPNKETSFNDESIDTLSLVI